MTNDGRRLDGYTGTIRSGGNSAMDDSDASFIIDDTQDFGEDSPRFYTDMSPAVRSERQGVKVINHQERPETWPSVSEEGQSGGSGLLYNTAYSYALSGSPHFVTDGRGKVRVHRDDEKKSEIQGYSAFLPDAEYIDVVDNHDKNIFQPNTVCIRKLTPREWWRLQGFPDWAFEAAEEENSDTQLYKQAGNAVTVNVVRDIADELAEMVQDE